MGGGYGFEKPSQAQIEEYEEELKRHVDQLTKAKLRVTPNNDKREINLKTAGPGKAIGKEAQKLKEMKEREKELARNSNAVIKTVVRKKRRGLKAKKAGDKAVADADED